MGTIAGERLELTPGELAAQYEAACVRARREFADEWIEVAGGVAPRSTPGSWMNRAEGLGMTGPVSDDEIRRVVAWYSERGLPCRIKVCPYADEGLVPRLVEQGFRLKEFEQVFAVRVGGVGDVVAADLPRGLELRVLDRGDERAIGELSRVLAAAFATQATPAVPSDLEYSARCMRRDRATTFGVYADGACVGGGGVEFDGDLAVLYGAAVSEGWRRRGVQRAIIGARLREAAQRGARTAIVSGTPGAGTERNALRAGFWPIYTKVLMVRAV